MITTFDEYCMLRESMGDITPQEWAQMHPEDAPHRSFATVLADAQQPETPAREFERLLLAIVLEEAGVGEKDFKGYTATSEAFKSRLDALADEVGAALQSRAEGSRMAYTAELFYEQHLRNREQPVA
jgi:hypothetical protein